MKEELSKKSSPELECKSCKENPKKLYSIPPAKWYCNDCSKHICNLCKEAHEKLKFTRTHVISPYGTILECNIENDLTIAPVPKIINLSFLILLFKMSVVYRSMILV